jgi:hypothetical protein
MSRHALDPSHPLIGRLAEDAIAADLFRATVRGATQTAREPAAASRSMRALLAYVRRDRGAPVDFSIEQAIRTDPVVARRYRNLLAGVAQAFSPAARAAATDPVPSRTLGEWRLEVSEQDGLSPVLVLAQQAAAPVPTAIEAVGATGVIRLMLPEPVNQTIQLPLDGDVAELAAFYRLIADPATSVYLL